MNSDPELSVLTAPEPPPSLCVTDAAVKPRPEPRLWRLFWAAATTVRNRCVIFAGTIAGLVVFLTGHPWLGLTVASIGTMGYSLLVLRDLFNPALIRQVHGLSELPKLPEITQSILRSPLRIEISLQTTGPKEQLTHWRAILTAHEAIRRQLVSADSTIQKTLLTTYQRCTEMVQMAVPRVEWGQTLSTYMAAHPLERLETERNTLVGRAESSDNHQVEAMFRAAINAQRFYLSAYRDMEHMMDRITAELAIVKVSLQAVGAQLVTILAEGTDIEDRTPAALEKLSELLYSDPESLAVSFDILEEPDIRQPNDVLAPNPATPVSVSTHHRNTQTHAPNP